MSENKQENTQIYCATDQIVNTQQPLEIQNFGLTSAPEGSGSLAKLQLLHELLRLRSGWTQGCRMFREQTKERKAVQEISMNVCILKQQYTTTNNQA